MPQALKTALRTHWPEYLIVAEFAISAGLLLAVLTLSSSARFARYTGLAAGCLVATYISVESPLSGLSMNPARSFASAAPSMLWQHFWIYLIRCLACRPPLSSSLRWPARDVCYAPSCYARSACDASTAATSLRALDKTSRPLQLNRGACRHERTAV